MHREDMEALLAGTYTVAANTKNAETREWVESVQTALTELLEQTRWRKTEEEMPGNVLLVFACDDEDEPPYQVAWTGESFVRGGTVRYPKYWLPIPEVSEPKEDEDVD